MTRWVTMNPTGILPRCACVYAFYLDGVLTYIGQTSDLRNRISEHRIRWGYANQVITPWGESKNVVMKVSWSRRYGDWAMRELRLIRRLHPPGNVRGYRGRQNRKTA